MKIYISADIEGVAGVTHWDEATIGKPGYERAAAQMTAEVAAACEAAVAAGADEILVQDAMTVRGTSIIRPFPKRPGSCAVGATIRAAWPRSWTPHTMRSSSSDTMRPRARAEILSLIPSP